MSDLLKRLNNLSPEKRELVLKKLRTQKLISAHDRSQAPAIVPMSREQEIPLSFAQQRLWFLDQLEGESSTYNMPVALSLNGSLKVEALEQALTEIVRRHEILRTCFKIVNGNPIQDINSSIKLTLPLVNLQELPDQNQSLEVKRLATEEAQQPFDLSQEPLLRVSLLKLAFDKHVLLLTMHHIISDGWSLGILVQELSVLYQAFCAGKPSPLPELPIQYADFAAWQRQWLQGEILEKQLRYWKQKLSGAPPLLNLPTDRPRPPVQTFQGSSKSFVLSQELTEKLKVLSHNSGVTLFMTLLSAWSVLLSRYSRQEELVIGSPIANRNRQEIEPLIGFFVNTLALRINLQNNPPFSKLLARVRQITLDAYAHQDLPFEQLVQELQPERNLSHSPLFQVMFVLQNVPIGKLELPGLTLTPIEQESKTAKFDLTLSMEETEQGLKGELEYNSDLFDAATIARMEGHFQVLLKGIVTNPHQPIGQLPLLTPAEQHQLLVEWNDTQADYPQDKCIHQLFEEQVERTPEAIAVVFEEQQLTYLELNSRANQLAHYLKSLGVGAEVLVGICVERSIEMIVGLLGILKAGGAYVPIDPAYPPERIGYMLEDAQVSVLLTQAKLLHRLPAYQGQVVCLDLAQERISDRSPDNLSSNVNPKNLAYVIYTSGSTGKPKGVLITHKGLMNLIFWHLRVFAVTSADRATQLAGIAFDASVWELWPYLAAGASIYLVEPEVIASPENLRDWLILQRISISFLPTPLAESLLALEWSENKALRLMLTGGDQLHYHRLTSIPFELVNNYGPTENTVVTTSGVVTRAEKNSSPTIGRPISNTQVYILDPYLQPVPIGVSGELHISSDSLARGYLNRPELTAEKFIASPFSQKEGVRLYKTGDLARYLPDGNLEFLGRIDHQVKIRGFRIELGEIETAIAAHLQVQEAVVIVREDRPNDKSLVAYVVPSQESINTDVLRDFLKQKLPQYMIPSAFIMLKALPLTPNGKVDRHNLPKPDKLARSSEKTYIPARNALEMQLVQIWEQVLGIHPIGVRDNFFDLGGHSLLAVQLIAQIQQNLGKNISLANLFQEATIEQLANFLSYGSNSQYWSSLVPIQPSGSKPPLFCIHAVDGNVLVYSDLARCLGSDRPLYGLQALGLDSQHEPQTRIEDMATHYIQELQSIYPLGPYCLAGWSIGGIIAFEMAQQLLAQGQQVSFLGLLDTYAVASNGLSERTDAELLIDLIAKDISASFDWNCLRQLKPKEQLITVMNRLKQLNLLPPDFELAQVLRLLQVSRSNDQAAINYTPKLYPGRIVYFKAKEAGIVSLQAQTQSFLEEIAIEGIETYNIPGSHTTILRPPYVQVLAKRLDTCVTSPDAHQR
ncbi:MAG: amino acid adenylation domain-containing protein [Xenococcaceae cyanobacterium]